MKTEVKELSCYKQNQKEASYAVIKAPKRTVSIDKIEVLSSEIISDFSIKNRNVNCFSNFTWCFWSKPVEVDSIRSSAVYQPTTLSTTQTR